MRLALTLMVIALALFMAVLYLLFIDPSLSRAAMMARYERAKAYDMTAIEE